jgi:predicted house-cleaning noncanonical NTP pyrophosphatase (MazG superfamily)
VSERIAQNLSSNRNNVTEEALMKLFEEIYQYLQDNNFEGILSGLCYVFIAEETAFLSKAKKLCMFGGQGREICLPSAQ